jgi:hypothetical protein
MVKKYLNERGFRILDVLDQVASQPVGISRLDAPRVFSSPFISV